MIKRKFSVMLAVVLMFVMLMAVGCVDLASCNENPRFGISIITTERWTLARYNNINRFNIVSADCETLVVDGVLKIPSMIAGHEIHGFGTQGGTYYGGPMRTFFSINFNLEIEKIVLAAELHIDNKFFGNAHSQNEIAGLDNSPYIQLLATTFERIQPLSLLWGYTIIIPTGSAENFINKIIRTLCPIDDKNEINERISRYTFYELTDWLDQQSNM